MGGQHLHSEQLQLALEENHCGSTILGAGQQKNVANHTLTLPSLPHTDGGKFTGTFLQTWQKINLHPCYLFVEADVGWIAGDISCLILHVLSSFREQLEYKMILHLAQVYYRAHLAKINVLTFRRLLLHVCARQIPMDQCRLSAGEISHNSLQGQDQKTVIISDRYNVTGTNNQQMCA